MQIKLSSVILKNFYESYKVFNDKNVLEMVEYGGRGGGKSSNVFIFPIIRIINEGIDVLILRKVANTLRTSVFNQVLWCIDKLGLNDHFKVNNSRMEIIYKGRGNGFYFRGADDPMKIKSFKSKFPVGVTIFEEVDQFKNWDEVDHIKQSVLRGDIDHFKLIYLFNPPRSKHHWVNQKFLYGNCEGIYIHKSDYRDNDFLPLQFFSEAEKAKNEDEKRYRWIYLGEPTGYGLVPFPNIVIEKEMDREMIERFDNIHQGIDWGWGEPFAFVRMHYDQSRKRIYIFDEIYGGGITDERAIKELVRRGYDDILITCDSAEPKSIRRMRENGMKVMEAKKGAGSRETGCKFLAEHTIFICKKNCPHTAREFETAEFKKDRYGNELPDVDGMDHSIDAVRYALERYYHRPRKEV